MSDVHASSAPRRAPLPPGSVSAPVEGYGIERATLGDVLGERLTLLVFLRHYG